MANPFIGEIRPFAFNFAPRGWAACDGATLAIATNQALFAILGTTYGGNGQTTFQLPDLRGRVPVHASTGAAGTVQLGERGGVENVSLTINELPSHGHTVQATANLASSSSPVGNVLAAKPRGGADVYSTATSLTSLAPTAVGSSGGSQPHPNMQPSLTVGFCIALTGVFPSRN